jgi:hypothetical protein
MRSFFAGLCGVLFVLAGWSAAPAGVQAETLGAYTHGELRRGDEKLVVCYNREQTAELAEGLNNAMLRLQSMLINAADNAERQVIYQEVFYPTPEWQALMEEIYNEACSLIDVADHTSRETVMQGPATLDSLAVSHSVVATDMYVQGSQASTPAFVITTERVPPVD